MKQASTTDFPYSFPGLVCYFDAELQQAQDRDGLRNMVRRALAGETTIYAVWPGQYRSDMFVIDKPELLAQRLTALTPRVPVVK